MQPLSPEEARWAKSINLLQKKGRRLLKQRRRKSYFDTFKSDPRKAFGCIAGACFILAVIGCVIFLAGGMQP
jgi:hypothetical protein